MSGAGIGCAIAVETATQHRMKIIACFIATLLQLLIWGLKRALDVGAQRPLFIGSVGEDLFGTTQ